jgi:hypothetical protein
LEDADLQRGYDLVFLIHSIFAFEDISTVDKILSLPNTGGSIVIVSNAQNSFLAGLKKIVDAGYSDNRFEISDLLKILEDRGADHNQVHFETKWAVSKDRMAEHIEEILGWLSLGKRAEINEESQEQINAYVRKNSVDLGHRVLFTERETIVVISL